MTIYSEYTKKKKKRENDVVAVKTYEGWFYDA